MTRKHDSIYRQSDADLQAFATRNFPKAVKTPTQIARLYVGADTGATADAIARTVARYFDGATIYPATGLWRGTIEPSFVVEVAGGHTADTARILAAVLRLRFKQQAVLLTVQEVTSELIT